MKTAKTIYSGEPQIIDEVAVFKVTVDSVALDPSASREVEDKATCFSWGGGCDTAAQLALALLLDFTGDADIALRFYRNFEWKNVAHWPPDRPWQLTGANLFDFLKNEGAWQ